MFTENIHYSHEIENAVIGACLLEPSAFARIYDVVKPDTFYSSENQTIYGAIAKMFDENIPTDLLTVTNFICKNLGVKDFNGSNVPFTLSKKTNSVISTANIEYYGFCLKQMWLDREVMRITQSGMQYGDGFEKLSILKDQINSLSVSTVVNDWQDMTQLMVGLYRHQEQMENTGGMGVSTGFKTIDKMYGGFHSGQMIVIAARPSVGKSALAGQIAFNMAQKGTRVGIVSLEMNNNEIAARMGSLDSDIDFASIFRGLYKDQDDRDTFYKKVSKSTSNLPIYVTDNTDVNVTEIKAKAYKLKQRHGLDCLIVDYLQLVGSDNNQNRNRENEVAKISRGFKIIAKELNVPLVVLAQLNRDVDKRKGKDRFPQLSDLRESGAIEQDADAVMFLHSDFKSGITQDENGNSTEGKANLVIRKWRNGDANIIVDLDFDGPKMRFNESSIANYGIFKSMDRDVQF
jgi:replicative DNA helicase